MVNWTTHSIRANGIRLHVQRTGGDLPPLVLAHGFTDIGLCWRRVALELEPHYDVIMYDARGHGLSDGPETGFGPHIQAADLAGLIEALDLKQPVIMGHSMGANTAALTAAQYPGLVRAAILEDPPWFLPVAQPQAEPDEEDGEVKPPNPWQVRAQQHKSMSHDDLMAACRDANPAWDEADIGDWADSKLQFNLAVFDVAPTPLQPTWWQETVRQIPVPTLLLTADPERGALVTPAVARQVLELGQDVRIAEINGAGHSIRREQFEPYMAAVKSFLNEHPA